MTAITIRQNGGRFRLTASGHATGSAEVCAAVSGLIYALAGSLKNLEQAGEVTLGAFRLESGAADLEAAGGPARYLFAMAAIGLMQIEAGYPENVRVESDLGAAFGNPPGASRHPPFQGGQRARTIQAPPERGGKGHAPSKPPLKGGAKGTHHPSPP